MYITGDGSGLILASKSPRRRRLLEKTGLSFRIVPSTVDESAIPLLSPDIYVKSLAEAKAEDVSGKYPADWVIGADTIVLIDGTILGKPDTRERARSMLKSLSGKSHQVLTGYAICCQSKSRRYSETVTTEVRFKTLTDEEIDWYIQTEEPYDKAGAYAIQGIGAFLVKRIDGSYTNVVGLPVCEVLECLFKEGIIELIPSNR